MFEKLRLRKTIAPVAAAAVAALGVGAVAIAQQSGSSTTPSTPPAAQGTSEAAEHAGEEHGGEQQLTGPDATRAKQAALAKVGSGRVTDVSSEKADPNEPKEAKEAGEQADPAYESRIAYDVEVTKADGSSVDVHLDKQFSVLGTEVDTETGEQSGKDDDGRGAKADAPTGSSAAPAAGSTR
jgi:Spy/CpxP family protein refolding chaperone